MGYGPISNGKQKPITPWKGSWAQQEQEKKDGLQPIKQRPRPYKVEGLSR